ncbi:hypothetical protein FO519_008507 [Halicephalobus sp. NKZ332]|nr:hypothetical protein FO519_008507 [Halicephalobus sp. NKZ332]
MFKILILCVAVFGQVRAQNNCASLGLQSSGPANNGACPSGQQLAGIECCISSGGVGMTTMFPNGFTPSGSSGPLAPGCSGPCIGNLCPSGLTCNTGTQQCCSSTGGIISGPGTTNCMDKVGPDGVSDCPRLSYLCNNSTYYGMNPVTGMSDCPALAYLCNNPVYNSVMMNQCPRTCNKCTSTGTIGGIPGTIGGIPGTTGGIPGTTGTTGLGSCIGPCIGNLCPSGLTCNTANQECCSSTTGGTIPGSTNCVDKTNPVNGTSDCPTLSYLCNDTKYRTLMTQQCPRTCGFCGTNGVIGTGGIPGTTGVIGNNGIPGTTGVIGNNGIPGTNGFPITSG